MTNEEAIIVLKYGMKYRNPKNDTEKDRNEALDMAISALSVPEGEYIKRSEATNALSESALREDDYYYGIAYHSIMDLPTYSVPKREKGEWIPVSERLPEAYQKILVTYEEIHWANEPTTYSVKLISFGGVVDFIAWQPLPEPYKAESEDKE